MRLIGVTSFSHYLSNILRHLIAECSIPIIINLAMLCSPTYKLGSAYFKPMTCSNIVSISSMNIASIGSMSYLFLIPVSGSIERKELIIVVFLTVLHEFIKAINVISEEALMKRSGTALALLIDFGAKFNQETDAF